MQKSSAAGAQLAVAVAVAIAIAWLAKSLQFAKLNAVQQQILDVLQVPYPAELFNQPATA